MRGFRGVIVEKKHGQLSRLMEDLGSGAIDLFVGSASFERRCLSIAARIDVSRVIVAVIGCNVTHLVSVKKNLVEMEKLFAGKVRRMEYYADDPVRSARNMAYVLEGIFVGGPKRVVMDITTFTREALLMLLLFLRRRIRDFDTLEFLYARAEEYSVGEGGSEKWLSRGIMEVRSVLGFPGQMRPSRATHMVVMVGFEFQRAVEIVEVCEPSFVSLGFADRREWGTVRHQEFNEYIVDRLRQVFRDVESFVFRAYDAKGTKYDLRRQIDKYPGCNVVVVPMHTKISTVGAALLALENDDVQLCYAPAKLYNVEDYSSAGDDYYWFKMSEFDSQ